MEIIRYYPALTCGADVYIVNEEMRFDLVGMNACFEKHRVCRCLN